MGKALDATKYGDPADCRTVANDWLKREVKDIYDNASDDVRTVHTKSYEDWVGTAGNAFRGAVGYVRDEMSGVADQAVKIGDALVTFADALTRDVYPKLDEAVETAKAGGLTVTGETDGQGRDHVLIEGPGPYRKPQCYPGGSAGSICVDTWGTANRAYHIAEDKIRDARQQEENAHRALRESLGAAEEGLLQFKKYFDTLLATKNKFKGDVTTLLAAAEEMTATGAILEKVRQGRQLTATEQRTIAMWLKLDKAMDAHVTSAMARRAQTLRDFAQEVKAMADTPGLRKAQRFLDANLADVATTIGKKTGNTTLVVFGGNEKVLKKLRGVPLIGTGYQIINAGIDVKMRGKSVEEVLAKTAAEYGKNGAVAVATRWGTKVIRFGGLIGAVGSTIVFDVLKPDQWIDDRMLDDEFEKYIHFNEKRN